MSKEITDTAYWDKGADIYDEIIQHEFTNEIADEWRNILQTHVVTNNTPQKILDVGTGPGFFAVTLAQLGHDVTAIDASPAMIQKAKQNAKQFKQNINFVNTDILDWEITAQFDIIISRNVTWFLRNPVATYQKWFQLLNPTGTLNIFDADWNYYLTNSKASMLQNYAEQLAIDHGYEPYRNKADIAEGERLAQTLPLSYVQRPEWDVQTLGQTGFAELKIVFDVDKNLNINAERELNKFRRMFLIQAKKTK